VCPHFDKTQSNGVLRANDFELMLKRHPQERGICIDHFAALIFEDETYRVLSLDGRPGSVLSNGTYSDTREGVPGVWIKDIIDGNTITTLVKDGRIDDLIKIPNDISLDIGVVQCRIDNPI
jgi:dipeptidase E